MMHARLERLKELLKQSPDDTFIRFAIAKEMEKSGRESEALDMMVALIQDNPEYIGAYYHIAALMTGFEDVTGALRIYDKGMEIASKLGDNHALNELKTAKMNLEMESM